MAMNKTHTFQVDYIKIRPDYKTIGYIGVRKK